MKPKELAEELGVTAMTIGKVRKKLGLPKGDLSEAEADMIRSELGDDVEDIGPKVIEATVTHCTEGDRRIGCGVIENGEKKFVSAFVPLNFDASKLWLRRIKLEYIDYEGQRYYRHIALADKTWAAMSPQLRNL